MEFVKVHLAAAAALGARRRRARRAIVRSFLAVRSELRVVRHSLKMKCIIVSGWSNGCFTPKQFSNS
jgi:hypothetical protein